MKRWKRTVLISTAEIAVLLVLHRVLIAYMAEHDVVSVIFSAGQHVPRLTLASAILFMLVRFLTVLALPGMILTRIGLVAMDALIEKRGDSSGSRETTETAGVGLSGEAP